MHSNCPPPPFPRAAACRSLTRRSWGAVAREHCEYLLEMMEDSHLDRAFASMQLVEGDTSSAPQPKLLFALSGARAKVKAALGHLERYQQANTERVRGFIDRMMPSDFRSRLLKLQNERSEASRAAEVAALVARGGSIAERFELMRSHQALRRGRLIKIGEAEGVFKSLIKVVGGVPEPLLAFVKSLNDEHGPIEEVRARFCPPLQALSRSCGEMRALLALFFAHPTHSAEAAGVPDKIAKAAREVEKRAKAFLSFLSEQMDSAPWMKLEIDSGDAKSLSTSDTISVTVAAGNVFQVPVQVKKGSTLCWEFTLESKDIDFHVAGPSGEAIVPATRHDASGVVEGSVVADSDGVYVMKWDNSFSYLTGKAITYAACVVDKESDDASLSGGEESGSSAASNASS
jgi:hypothetical protein